MSDLYKYAHLTYGYIMYSTNMKKGSQYLVDILWSRDSVGWWVIFINTLIKPNCLTNVYIHYVQYTNMKEGSQNFVDILWSRDSVGG